MPECGGDDCNDRFADVFPGAEDALGDGRDTSCDGIDGIDADRDGYLGPASEGDDCDDANPTINPGRAEEEWTLETIADQGDTGHFIRVAVGPDGIVHVTYADLTARQIRHARRIEGEWRTETVVRGSFAAHDLAIAADGTPILCHDLIGPEWSSSWLSCGRQQDGEWTFEDVDESGWTGVDPSVRIGADGTLHVAYGTVDADRVTLRYATDASGEWVSEDVDLEGGRESSAELDADGALHVAYVGVTGSIRYATNAGGTFRTEEVEAGPGLQGPTVVVSEDGDVHVSYDRGGAEVRWATRTGAGWRPESVTDNPSGASPAVVAGVLDPLGSVHLFFPRTDAEAWGLGHATNVGGTWQTEIVDLDSVGQYSAATVRDGLMYVAYLGGHGSDGDALFAFRGAPDGLDSDCDGSTW